MRENMTSQGVLMYFQNKFSLHLLYLRILLNMLFMNLHPIGENWRLITDKTAHLSHTTHSFDKWRILILYIYIASYSITHFYTPPLYFTLQVKPQTETIQGALPPHQTTDNTRNGSSLISASPSAQKWGFKKEQP